MDERTVELENLVDNLSSSLAEGYFQIVQILSRLILTTEKYYEGSHSRFISEKSELVAQELGMNDEDITEVKIAGLLHDIGKIGFQETLLYKYPTEMTQFEYQQYLLHPEIGYNFLKPNNNFDNIAKIVLQHHEKLDGSGFPKHLQKDNIHPAAKIILIVDYYHNAMFKRQRQKNDVSSQNSPILSTMQFLDSTKERYAATMNYLHKKAGILFDKKMVSIFTEIVEFERRNLGVRTVMRIHVSSIEPGMIFAEDYFTSYGLLVAAKGEVTTRESISSLTRFVENGEVPIKILMIK